MLVGYLLLCWMKWWIIFIKLHYVLASNSEIGQALLWAWEYIYIYINILCLCKTHDVQLGDHLHYTPHIIIVYIKPTLPLRLKLPLIFKWNTSWFPVVIHAIYSQSVPDDHPKLESHKPCSKKATLISHDKAATCSKSKSIVMAVPGSKLSSLRVCVLPYWVYTNTISNELSCWQWWHVWYLRRNFY